MSQRAVEILVTKYNFNKNDAERYVSEIFNIIDSETKEKGYKPITEEKKADFAVAGVEALKQFVKEIAEGLK
jgi:hypothetical protein